MTAKWEQPGTILSLLREVLAALVVGLVLLGPACATSRHEVAAPKLNRPAQQIQLPIVCRDIDLSDQASPPRLTDLCDYNLETVWTLTKADGPEEQWIRFGFDHAIVLSRIVVFLEGLAGLGVSTPATGHSQTFKQDELQFDSIVVYLDNKKTDDLRITAWRDTSAGGSPASYISEVHLYGWEPADEIPLALIARSVSTSQ